MVVTRSQSRREGGSPPRPHRADDNNAAGALRGDAEQDPPQERLGRGCRIPREPPASYDTMYVRKVLLPPGRRHEEGEEEIHINSRYPQRDAARRAVIRMSSTLHSLGMNSARVSGAQEGGYNDDDDEGDDDNGEDDGSSAKNCSEGCAASLQPRGKKGNDSRLRQLLRKRGREPSIDSSITEVSLREETQERGNEVEQALLVEHSSSLSSLTGRMSERENRRVSRNARESTIRHIPINRYLDEVIEATDNNARKEKKRRGKSHRRRMEDVFLGLDAAQTDTMDAGKTGEGPSTTETPAPLGDITPLHIDRSVSFEKVGGLSGHIVLLREMVLFPLLYPDLLQTMNLTPPRGVLFIGPPGTGKTLMARALANEAASCAQRKISFFMRKGADILSKWVGESERQLSLLFEEARRRQPSIIFFDEIDGLVPVRHAKAEQSQAALVATLLALIDGLDDRGQVVVIGATNRPDTIDPALRRPGRLDRELHFPLPDAAARRHILSIVTKPIVPLEHPERSVILEELVARCEGWSGAEIQALCTEAGLNRLRTSLPQLYVTSRKLQIPNNALSIQKEDFLIAIHRFKTSVRRGADSFSKGLEEHLEHLLHSTRTELVLHVASLWPSAATALARERRDCSDASDAVRELSGFPIPHTAQPILLFLTPSPEKGLCGAESCEFALEKAALALIKALPSMRVFTVHLPNLVVDRGSAAMMMTAAAAGFSTAEGGASNAEESGPPLNDCFSSGHIYSLVLAILRCSGPSLVLLQGLDVWLAEYGCPTTAGGCKGDDESDEDGTHRRKNMESFCYYLALLRDSDVLVVAPTLHMDVYARFFAELHPSTQIRKNACSIPCAPSEDDLRRFLQYLFHVVELALLHSVPTAWEELLDDVSPPPPPSIEEVRAARHVTLELWRRVEHRRRQLRYVLAKWLSQYLNSRKFSLFCSADLDLTPGHDLYEEWRHHTHGRRIGLCDVMEKLENEEYTSLSQYHDDIDMLVRNVRTFFRTRSSADQRYRSRALELKETTVLNLYKINRNVVQFCEKHKDLAEPDLSLSSCSSQASLQAKREPPTEAQTAQRLTVRRRRPPHRYYGSRRRRRRRRPVSRAASKSREEEAARKAEEEAEVVEEEEEEEEGKAVAGGEASNNGNEVAVKTEPVATESPTGEAKEADDRVATVGDCTNVNNYTAAPSPVTLGGRVAEIDAAVQLLRGLSFLALHGVFQAAMSLLEAETNRRRSRQQCATAPPLPGTSEGASTLFFPWLVSEALRTAVEEGRANGGHVSGHGR
ncbi:putative ATPase [Trypanosoma conorhini]|uniref:Putative ATPase n=1 Tax=Trypanosoma conorhini TaxID=83891 RepID=A0A422PBY7_9TRYP|nr:putative ATPase [Trypanosoma conorhini]RNF15224.1 putative ATPase [Trypanosoma conorhini]